ncbi:uncharacterized protein LOC133199291 [Saccostrea echinata]|uniref:uncharacterized protein LOC133199291 n=1 Tax=Saccostrea echinata TaxID=191078 RepID=UPI002A83F84E|nr:uncharacterized protein LOC133199291 [Saccostrea echinata]
MPPKQKKRRRTTESSELVEPPPKQTAMSKDCFEDKIQSVIQAAIPSITKAVIDELSRQQQTGSATTQEKEAATVNAAEPTVNLGPRVSGPMYKYGPRAFSSSPNNANTLTDIAASILENSLAPNSRAAYEKTFGFYSNFMSTYFPNVSLLPPTTEHLAHFIAFCFQSNIAASTLKT